MIIYVGAIALNFGFRAEDFNENKLKEIFEVTVLCLFLSMAASTFSFNIYIGTVVSFIIIFCLYYFYSYEHKASKGMILVCYYVMIITFPIGINQFPIRALATIYGVVITFVLYYLAFRKDFKGNIKNTINKSIDNIIGEINEENENKGMDKSLRLIRDDIYNKIDSSKDDDAINKHYLDYKIVNLLIIMNHNKVLLSNKKIIDENFLLELKDFYNGKIEKEKFEKILDKVINLSNEKKSREHSEELLINAIVGVKICLENKILEEHLSNKFKIKNIIKKHSFKYNLGYDFTPSMKEFKFNYAIKGSILISLVLFTVYYFKVPLGKWILYTIMIDNVPFLEKGVKKARDRIFGTILGFFAVIMVFSLTSSTMVITALILLSLYFVFCAKSYDRAATFITFAAISGFTLLDHYNVYTLSIDRIILVLTGSFFIYIVLKFIYPYSSKNAILDLIERFKFINEALLNNINNKEALIELDIVNRELIRKGNFLSTQFNQCYLDEILSIENSLILDLNNLYYSENNNVELKVKAKINKFDILAEKVKESYEHKKESKFNISINLPKLNRKL